MTTAFSLIYVTFPDDETALSVGRAVVSERLAACANILGRILSVYWWDGRINEEGEVALLFKTRADLSALLIDRVRALHPYTCPCIVSVPIGDGNPAFLEWLAAETMPAPYGRAADPGMAEPSAYPDSSTG
jgi:periplasmic divalent cation tolerance protein